MIEIQGLSKSYDGKKEVLKDLNVKIADASVFGLVGINGAGKSTLLRVIAGVLRADKGQVCVDGENVFENERVKGQLFFLPDDPYYGSNVSALGLADLYKSVYDFNEAKFLEYLEKFALDPKKPIRNFSKGMKRQVFVSIALAIAPKYLLLDEAFDGLDPLARLVFKRAIVELVEEKNATVIISSHSLRELEDVCDSYGILDHGGFTCSGELETDMGTVHKFQAAFAQDIEKADIGFECMSFEKKGKVVYVVARGDKQELLEKLQALQPLFVEEIEVDFEEMFIGEVEARGYLK